MSDEEKKEDEFPEEARKFYNAIEILSKNPEWPIFCQWVRKQIAYRVKGNSAPIGTEVELRTHNFKAGEIAGMDYVISIPKVIASLKEYDTIHKALEELNDLENSNY